MIKYIISITTLFFISCSGSKVKIRDFNEEKKYKINKSLDSTFVVRPKRIATSYKGFKYPYIHINGFKNYEISPSKFLNEDIFKNINELKFYHTYSSYYTRQTMYENYGNWDKAVFITGLSKPYLLWENINLFKNSKQKYTIIAGGFESTTSKSDEDRIYASVFVLDEKGNDCLNDKNSVLSNQIIAFFSNGISKLTNDKEFYNKFHKYY